MNDFRVGLNTVLSNNLDYFAVNGPKDAGTALGIPGFNSDTMYGNPGIPSIYVDVLGQAAPRWETRGANWYQDDRTIDGYDELSYTRGRHNIMAGARAAQAHHRPRSSQRCPRHFNFNGRRAARMRAIPARAMARPILFWAWLSRPPLRSSPPRDRSANGGMDSSCWITGRYCHKLTLNYGLRYELPTVPYSLNGYTRILNADDTALIPATTATTPGDI